MAGKVGVAVYSDYLCPWCYVAAVRLGGIEAEYGEQVGIEWKSFLLLRQKREGYDPRPSMARSWLMAGAEEGSIRYSPWPATRPLPSSSVPAQAAAKCARRQGKAAFGRYHLLLLAAFFERTWDVSDREVLIALAGEAGLDREAFVADFESGAVEGEVLADYREALADTRFSGVPTAIFDDVVVLEGAVPIEMYRRAVDVRLARQAL